jgi:hypothetical protein
MKRLLAGAALAALLVNSAEARITRLEILRTEPAFGGQVFGDVGAYEHVTAIAHGELDPADPRNAIIQDLNLAPRTANGMVEYATNVEFLKPADMTHGNRIVMVEVANRGRKLAVNAFDDGLRPPVTDWNALTSPGDGWLMREGYSLAWFGWQMDLLPGAGRIVMPQIVARNPDGSPITGIVRSEMTALATTTTLPISSSWQVADAPPDSYPAVSTDNRQPAGDGVPTTLTVRAREQDPRVPIANGEWSFGTCGAGEAAKPDDKHLCYPAGFQPGRLYELIYRAKDPWILGLGFAAARDLGVFLRDAARDQAGNANPLYRVGQFTILEGTSQSGRMVRTFLHLGFNEAEGGQRAYDGLYPHIGGGLIPLIVRFGQPGRAWGEQSDHLYPAYDFPFTYGRETDPLTLRTQGILDRCAGSGTCPKIFHVATVLEVWEGRQSLGITDPLGRTDLADPPNVRTFIMASTQHGPASLPLQTQAPFGNCQQQPNPDPQIWTMRALLTDLTQWVRDGTAPPAGVAPRIAEGQLVPVDQVRFPPIPANRYGGVDRPAIPAGVKPVDTLHVLDFGPLYRAADGSGIITVEPPRVGTASYGVLVPQVDADGNDIGGIRSVFARVPIGTYTGWNLGRKDRFENGFCNLQGSFIPFAATKTERDATGDPRRSIAERYPTKEAYVSAFREAAQQLVAARLLLPADADALVARTEQDGIRSGP